MESLKKNIRLLEFLVLIIILLIAADLRIFNVANTPGWYNDEGTSINLAANLLKGRIEYFGVQGSMLFPARMPLFIAILASIFKIFGVSISALRVLTGSIGVINTALVYFIIRKHNRPAALICALIFAIFPSAVLYSRLGFSYNLLATLVLIMFWSCNQYLDTGDRKYAVIGALSLGLSLLSELVSVAYIPVFFVVILWVNWKDLSFTFPLAFFPVILYTGIMLWISPQYYLSDLQYTFLRVSSPTLPVQFMMILINFASVHQDSFMLMGAIGIFLYPEPGLNKRLILFLYLPLIIISRTITISDLSWYYLIPFFSFFAIGVGLLISKFIKSIITIGNQLFDQFYPRIGFKAPQYFLNYFRAGNNLVFIILLVIAPIIFIVYTTHTMIIDNNFATELEPVLADASEARQVVAYINENANADDLIIASPSIAWSLNANATDWHISLAYLGLSTQYFPNDIPHDRFRFNPSYQYARYIVIDPVWMNWGEYRLEDLEIVRHFAEHYPVVYNSRQFTVYEISNP